MPPSPLTLNLVKKTMTHSHFNKKIFAIGLGLFLATNFLAITAVYAAPYVPLAPLPIGEGGASLTEVTNAGVYIKGAFNLAIGIAAALAIIMIIIGGIQYMGSESLGGKSAGRKRINDAVLGLLLALGSYLILFTINPSLVNFNVNIGAITPPTTPPTRVATNYKLTYTSTVFILRYQENEYELAYQSSTSGNLVRERYENQATCQTVGETAARTGSFTCTKKPKLQGTSLGTPLVPGRTYLTAEPITHQWATQAQCTTDKNTLSIIHTILNDCGEGASTNIIEATPTTIEECRTLANLKRSQGFFIVKNCEPVYP